MTYHGFIVLVKIGMNGSTSTTTTTTTSQPPSSLGGAKSGAATGAGKVQAQAVLSAVLGGTSPAEASSSLEERLERVERKLDILLQHFNLTV